MGRNALDSRFRGNDIKESGNDRRGRGDNEIMRLPRATTRNDIVDKRDACPTLFGERE